MWFWYIILAMQVVIFARCCLGAGKAHNDNNKNLLMAWTTAAIGWWAVMVVLFALIVHGKITI